MILKESVFSASIVPFTVMFPELLSITNSPSSLPGGTKRKDKVNETVERVNPDGAS